MSPSKESAAPSTPQFLTDLIQINREITSILDLDPLLEKIAEHTRRFVPYEVFAILLLDPETEELSYRFSIGHPQSVIDSMRIPLGEGIVGTAAKEQRTVVVDDVAQDARYINVVSATRSELAVPLIRQGRVIGVLDIESPEPAYFNDDQVQILDLLASQIAIAIANADLYESERRNREVTSLLYDISLEVASTLDVEELIHKIAKAVKSEINYHIFSIFLLDDTTRMLTPRLIIRHNTHDHQRFAIPLGQGLVGTALQENRPLRVGNVAADQRYIGIHPETVSEMVIPLAFKGRMVGVLDLESPNPNDFSEYDERLLMTLATRIASALVNAELHERVAANERQLAQELEVAREIQLQLMPSDVPPMGPLVVDTSFVPVAHLGGDCYDFIRFDDGRVAVSIGDVSGKGAAAALHAALASGIIRTRATRKYAPAEMLELVNKSLRQRPIGNQYIALTYAVFDPQDHTLTMANSGLPYPIHVHGDEVRLLALSGIPLGLFANSKYQESVVQMEVGDLIVLYTDGIVERRGVETEEFGLRRLANVIQENRTQSPAAIIEAVDAALEGFTRHRPADDDQTIIVLKWPEVP